MKKRRFVRCGQLKLYRSPFGGWMSDDARVSLIHSDGLEWFVHVDNESFYVSLADTGRPASAARKLGSILVAAQGLLGKAPVTYFTGNNVDTLHLALDRVPPKGSTLVDLDKAWNAITSSAPLDLKVNGARPEPAPNPCAEHCERPGGPCLERATRVEKLHYEAAALTGLVRALRCPEKDCVLPRRHSGGCGVVVDGNEVAEFTDTRLYRVEVRFARVGASPAEVIESVPVIARNEDAALQIAADRVRAAYPFCAVIGVRIAPPLAVPLPSGVTAAPSEIDTGEHDA